MAVRLWPFALALFLSACAYRSGFVDNPISRKASWFSYVDGADLRAACKPGTPDRTRLIYNADYQTQVRSYDLGESEPGHLVSRVSGSGNLTAGLSLNDPLGPWRGAKAETVLTTEQMRQLEGAFQASHLFEGSPVGLNLPSDHYYWVAAACRDGRFSFNAWIHPSPRFDRLSFPRILLALDKTGVPEVAPRPVMPPVLNDRDRSGVGFTLKVGRDGLAFLPEGL